MNSGLPELAEVWLNAVRGGGEFGVLAAIAMGRANGAELNGP